MSCPNVAKNMANITPNVKNFFSRGGPREANVIGKIGIFLVDGSGEYGHHRPCAPQLAVDAEVIMASESPGVCQKADRWVAMGADGHTTRKKWPHEQGHS